MRVKKKNLPPHGSLRFRTPPSLWPGGEFFVLNDHIFISIRELEKEISPPLCRGGVRSEAVGGG